jgi:hypothetical protein
LNFTKFDPKLGTLEAVNLTLSYSYTHGVTMTFFSPATGTVSGDHNTIVVDRPDRTILATASAPNYAMSQTYNGPDFPHMITLPPQTATGSIPVTLTSASDLVLFTQSSPSDTLILLPVTAKARSNFSSNTGNGGGGASVTAGLVATLSYTYVPIPEPSTLTALGLGFAGYLFARRARRSVAA